MGLLARLVLRLLRMCIAEDAKDTPLGKEGRIAKVFLIFPLIIGGVFAGLSCFLWMNPVDPERIPDKGDEMIGWCFLILTPALLIWMVTYFVSFRVRLEGNVLTTSSLVTRRKQARLDEEFHFFHDEEKDNFQIAQGDTVIKLSWIVNGYAEFLNLVWMKSRRWP